MDDLINQTATAIERAAIIDANGDETVDIIRVRRILRDFRAEALKLAADRAVEWMNKDNYFDPPEPFDHLRRAIMADKQEEI